MKQAPVWTDGTLKNMYHALRLVKRDGNLIDTDRLWKTNPKKPKYSVAEKLSIFTEVYDKMVKNNLFEKAIAKSPWAIGCQIANFTKKHSEAFKAAYPNRDPAIHHQRQIAFECAFITQSDIIAFETRDYN